MSCDFWSRESKWLTRHYLLKSVVIPAKTQWEKIRYWVSQSLLSDLIFYVMAESSSRSKLLSKLDSQWSFLNHNRQSKDQVCQMRAWRLSRYPKKVGKKLNYCWFHSGMLDFNLYSLKGSTPSESPWNPKLGIATLSTNQNSIAFGADYPIF